MEQTTQEEILSIAKDLQSSIEKINSSMASNQFATKSDVERVFQLNQILIQLFAEQSQAISQIRSLIVGLQNQNDGGLA